MNCYTLLKRKKENETWYENDVGMINYAIFSIQTTEFLVNISGRQTCELQLILCLLKKKTVKREGYQVEKGC